MAKSPTPIPSDQSIRLSRCLGIVLTGSIAVGLGVYLSGTLVSNTTRNVQVEPISRQTGQQPRLPLVDWVMQHGATFANIEMIVLDGAEEHRGMFAKQDIARDETIITIPDKLIFSTSKAKSTPIGRKIMKVGGEWTSRSYVLLAMFLLQEKALGNKSFWKVFLDSLPSHFRNVPINFNDEEVALLKSAPRLHKDYILAKESLQNDYNKLVLAIPEIGEQFSLAEYSWASSCVSSRAFSLLVRGETATVMMPFADMINHDHDNDAVWTYSDQMHETRFYAKKTVHQGKELSLSYGPKPNAVLLATYGFAVQNNPNRQLITYISLPSGDPIDIENLRVEKSGNPSAKLYSIYHELSPGAYDEQMIKALRLCRVSVATVKELEDMTDSSAQAPISLRMEWTALKYLEHHLESLMSDFVFDVELDEEALLRFDLTNNQRNILIAKISEKKSQVDVLSDVNMLTALANPSMSFHDFNARRYKPEAIPFKAYLDAISALKRII